MLVVRITKKAIYSYLFVPDAWKFYSWRGSSILPFLMILLFLLIFNLNNIFLLINQIITRIR